MLDRTPRCVKVLREGAGGKKSVGGARDRDNGELRFSLRSIQVRENHRLFFAVNMAVLAVVCHAVRLCWRPLFDRLFLFVLSLCTVLPRCVSF